MHYYKRNLGDYAKKAGRLSMLQHGAYTLLIDACYDREQFPTRDEAIDWTWASSTAEIEAVDFVLSKFFTLEDGRYVQKRIQEEVAAYHETSETNKRIAAEREAKRREALTNRARTVNEAPPNQEPRTINQEPNTEEPSVLVGSPDGDTDAKLGQVVELKTQRIPCPAVELVEVFHAECPTLPRVMSLSDARRKHLTARWREVDADSRLTDQKDGIELFRAFFQRVNESDFLSGRNGKWPACNFDWLVAPSNFLKVWEGNYDNDRRAVK
jgi:uncharacterized protein YdaU (DUF1376 family)